MILTERYFNNSINKNKNMKHSIRSRSRSCTSLEENFEQQMSLDHELNAPICNLDIEEWLEQFDDDDIYIKNELTNDQNNNFSQFNKNTSNFESSNKNKKNSKLNSNLVESIDICNSLEDLVKTFDQNVKKSLSNYKDIDIGQLAPVQVRSQEQLLNESQMWYTLTGNFGNLLPIPSDYGSKSLYKKYHKDSLDIKDKSPKKQQQSTDTDFENFDEDYDEFDYGENSNYSFNNSSSGGKNSELFGQETDFEFDEDTDDEYSNNSSENDDDDELRDQLDMHSMILSKSIYNENGEMDDMPYVTAEEVLNEIETMMTLQDEYYDEMTPDSGCFSVSNNNVSSFSGSESLLGNKDSVLPIDVNGSYLTYINTFALHNTKNINNNEFQDITDIENTENLIIDINNTNNTKKLIESPKILTNKTDLAKFNIYELNDFIDQIETSTKVLSDTLVQELDLRDEYEFEKETKNTFISLLMSIQEKRRLLNMESLTASQYSNRSAQYSNNNSSILKKRNRRSMINLDSIKSTHLTTIIPYNNDVDYTVQHIEILNKLLKAIDDDSNQVPELLTNYILKVVCPT